MKYLVPFILFAFSATAQAGLNMIPGQFKIQRSADTGDIVISVTPGSITAFFAGRRYCAKH